MPQSSNFRDDEIDLREFLAALWSHKIIIVFFTGLFILLAGYYALTTQKKFAALAVFQINKPLDNSSGINIPTQLGALASFAGITSGTSGSASELLLERTSGREFILTLNEAALLDRDPYFNTFDPDHKDPLWKATIKRIIGWQKTELEKNAIIENNIINSYRQNVKFDETEGGAITVSVTHIDPKKASYYANTFMEETRRLVESESITAQNQRLRYLSETLADAVQETEIAQENLKNYAFQNSALAQENFISDSLKLDSIRMEKRKVTEIADLLSIIEGIVKSGNLDSGSYQALRSNHPLVDDVNFRRILGMSETISAWAWPEIDTIRAVSITLRDRIERLDLDINYIEENAKIYASSAENLSKFRRDAKIAEATYTVLIEQVKSQTLAAGFQPDNFKVFEYATPPLLPSSPKRNFILALGAVVGMFIGCALAILNILRKGVHYTRASLLANARAEHSLKSKTIRRLSRKPISDMMSFVSERRTTVLDEAALKLANRKIIYVLDYGGKLSASNAARLLAAQSAHFGRKVVLCDTTGQSYNEIKESSTTESSKAATVSVGDNISVMIGADDASFFTSQNFSLKIKDLTDRFDQVFVCSSNINARLGLMAMSEYVHGLVIISGLRKTKKSDIKNVKLRQPIDLLFYD